MTEPEMTTIASLVHSAFFALEDETALRDIAHQSVALRRQFSPAPGVDGNV